MPTEIGPALREARMRQKIDIVAVEAETKIRAKYLRALENEEWDLLPGPSYVRSFLRTYANALSLDGDVLVDEYRRRYEAPDTGSYPLVEPMLRDPRRGRRRERRPIQLPEVSSGARAAIAAVAVTGVLLVLGLTAGSDDNKRLAGEPAQRTTQREPGPARQAAPPPRSKQTKVSLRLHPEAPVWVCLVGRTERGLVNGVVLNPGDDPGPFSAKRFQVTFGNGSITMEVDGRDVKVPESASPLGYEITPERVRPLDPDARPTCA